MRTRNLHPLVRLIASLLFGIAVLAFFAVVSAEMATHHFQGVAERAIRQAFAEAGEAGGETRSDLVCRRAESPCDPTAILTSHALRSTSCGDRSVLHLLGKPWSCVARFTDGGTLDVRVWLGLRRHRLELLPPVGEPDA